MKKKNKIEFYKNWIKKYLNELECENCPKWRRDYVLIKIAEFQKKIENDEKD